jgi:tellurite resistance protein
METLLEQPPGKEYMDESLAVLRELVADNNRRAEALVDLCVAIAEAHGSGLLGLRDPIDARERQALHAVAEALGERAQVWLEAKFGKLG